MLSELILFATLALHHLMIGTCLLGLLLVLIRLSNVGVEMQSWLWLTAFILTILIPFSLLVQGTFSNRSTNINEVTGQYTIPISSKTEVTTTVTTKDQALPLQISSPQWNIPGEFVLPALKWLYLFLIIWLLGICWRTFNILRSIHVTRKLILSAKPIEQKLNFERYGVGRVLVSSIAKIPMAAGLFSPVIILPNTLLKTFDEKKLLPIILHEQAHIHRKDLWVGLFQEAFATLFWWSPIIRILNRKIYLTRELACDMRAAQALSSGKQYAQSLLDCAKLMLLDHKNIQAMGLFSKKKDLNYRVNEVLKLKSTRRPKILTVITLCTGIAVATLATAQSHIPQINLSNIKKESNHFSKLSSAQGEMLVEAIENNDLGTLKLMLENGLDINTPVPGDGTAMIIAVKNNNQDMLEALIQLGADVNQSAEGDGNPLITAAMTGNLPFAKLLYQYGADINAIVKGDETPLINASRQGYFEMVKFLVENGADVNLGVEAPAWRNAMISTEYRSPLNSASIPKIREYLISMGAK